MLSINTSETFRSATNKFECILSVVMYHYLVCQGNEFVYSTSNSSDTDWVWKSNHDERNSLKIGTRVAFLVVR